MVKDDIITQRFGHGRLNSVPRAQQEAYEKVIPRVPMKNGKILSLTPSQVLQALYRRDSVAISSKARTQISKDSPPSRSQNSYFPSHLQQRFSYYGEQG